MKLTKEETKLMDAFRDYPRWAQIRILSFLEKGFDVKVVAHADTGHLEITAEKGKRKMKEVV